VKVFFRGLTYFQKATFNIYINFEEATFKRDVEAARAICNVLNARKRATIKGADDLSEGHFIGTADFK